jgi:MMP 1-O-methyltransferase
MPDDEGEALAWAATSADPALGPFLEVGSYCGKSACYLGPVAARAGTVLYCLDHHRGSEENQRGWPWHEPDLVDPAVGQIDSLPFFRRTIHDAGLEETVVALVGHSPVVARHWSTPLSFLFIDGGHGADVARADYDGWTVKVASGGLLAIHDVFTDPADGGQAPHEQIYQPALASGIFADVSAAGSLRVLRRL